MLRDDIQPVPLCSGFNMKTHFAHIDPAKTLGEQIVQISGCGHGVVGAGPDEYVSHKVVVGDEEYTVLDKGYDMEHERCTVSIINKAQSLLQTIRVDMGNEDGLMFHQPTTTETLQLMAQLIKEGTWSEPQRA